jgi:hypothetical protein
VAKARREQLCGGGQWLGQLGGLLEASSGCGGLVCWFSSELGRAWSEGIETEASSWWSSEMALEPDAGQRPALVGLGPALVGGPALAGLRAGLSRFALFRGIFVRAVRRFGRKLEDKIIDFKRNKRN